MPVQQRYAAGKLALDLDGLAGGWVRSVEGGSAFAAVISDKEPGNIVRKHLGAVQYEDITVRCGADMSPAFYERIKASVGSIQKPLGGAIHYCDYDGDIVYTRAWQNGLIREIGFPASDASDKDPAFLTIRIAPEITQRKAGGGKIDASKYAPVKSPKWLVSNFRLSIDGCEEASNRISSIEAFSIRQQILDYPTGAREYEKEAARLEFPNLVFFIPESHAEPFYQWHQSFVIDGKNDVTQEKTGRLAYLSSDAKSVLFAITLHGLGIFRLTPEKVEAGSENIRRLKTEMYCESMTFEYGSGPF